MRHAVVESLQEALVLPAGFFFGAGDARAAAASNSSLTRADGFRKLTQ